MATSTLPSPTAGVAAATATVPPEDLWRFSVRQYHAMIRAGILTEDDPVELLEGMLVTKMAKNPPHRLATRLTRRALEALLPEGWFVDVQEPITTEDSEPEPDLAVVRGTERDYAERHPGPEDLALVVEVADSSLQRDRTLKRRLYAAAGIPVYWVLNLAERQLEVYTGPTTSEADVPDYQHRQDCSPEDEVAIILDGTEFGRVTVRDLLP